MLAGIAMDIGSLKSWVGSNLGCPSKLARPSRENTYRFWKLRTVLESLKRNKAAISSSARMRGSAWKPDATQLRVVVLHAGVAGVPCWRMVSMPAVCMSSNSVFDKSIKEESREGRKYRETRKSPELKIAKDWNNAQIKYFSTLVVVLLISGHLALDTGLCKAWHHCTSGRDSGDPVAMLPVADPWLMWPACCMLAVNAACTGSGWP